MTARDKNTIPSEHKPTDKIRSTSEIPQPREGVEIISQDHPAKGRKGVTIVRKP